MKGDVPQMRKRRKLLVAGCALAAGVTLAACSSGGTSSTGSGSTSGTSGGNASFNAGLNSVVNPSSGKGGTLTYGVAATPDSFDGGNEYYAWTLNMSRLWATPLTTYKSCPGACSNTLIPGIATGLGQVSTNGLVWTYHIKQGLKFSDGTPITSADVKYAVERTYDRGVLGNGPTYVQVLLADPKYPGPYKDKTGDLTSVTTPDANTIEFHLASPFPDFDYVVAFPQTAPVPKAKDTGANYQQNPVSSGPYMFQSYQLNKQYTLVPNPAWQPSWNPQVKQLASKIIVNLNVNANDIDSRLLAGDIQLDQAGSGVQAAARARILSTPSLKANSDAPINAHEWFYYINTKVPPLNNLHCRMAVEFAYNKTNMQTAYGGPVAGGDIASTAMLPNIRGFQKFDFYNAFSKPGGDIAAAKQQLKLCGHPNGFNVNIAYRSDRPREVASSTALQASLAQAGIKGTLKGFTAATYYGNFAGVPTYVHSHSLGLLAGGWGPDWPNAYGWGWALYDSKAIVSAGNANISELNDPNIDKWFIAMQSTTNQSQSDAYANMINRQVMKDAALLPAVYAKALLYRPPNLTNVYIQPFYGMYNYGVIGTK